MNCSTKQKKQKTNKQINKNLQNKFQKNKHKQLIF